VNNAVRYTDHGGVLIALRRRGAALQFQVWDTGIGIPPERHADVFNEFVQLHNPERDRSQGLGLGLAIVRRMAELLGAVVALRSVPGRGSVFTVTLPDAGPGEPLPAAAAPAAPAAVTAPGLWVLVVDDDADIRSATQVLLQGWGCEVMAAAAVDALMPQLATRARVPDLIISDYRLGGDDDGLAAIARLQGEYNEDIPAILVTGDTAPERLLDAQRSGLALLHKPVTPEALRAVMAQVLAPHAPDNGTPLSEGLGT
jgi:CheY-like chemotaxis protein